MGIKELIGRGSSRFRGSISSRIHNIALASSRFNGVLVKPGEIFSFNKALGDVSIYTGYKEAYIIKDGKTVLGDGGGVCQVSTTFFRAILSAGLPVVERRAHAYRVGYYEQDSSVGFDATVYDPSPDLKFKNDTPGHLLIQTYVNTRAATLVFEIYGTSDSRIASTTKPVVTDIVSPPEDLYVDDPTLPIGSVKQIDWKAWGAKAWFTYKVTRDKETIYQKTFYSNYRPWQAIYLRGTGPVQ
jgi:vancomycin resistance protein YoaR